MSQGELGKKCDTKDCMYIEDGYCILNSFGRAKYCQNQWVINKIKKK